jgi:hypothetical protein
VEPEEYALLAFDLLLRIRIGEDDEERAVEPRYSWCRDRSKSVRLWIPSISCHPKGKRYWMSNAVFA